MTEQNDTDAAEGGGNGPPVPMLLHSEGTVSVCIFQEKLFVSRAETVSFSCEISWFPVRNLMVFRAKSDGFSCGR